MKNDGMPPYASVLTREEQFQPLPLEDVHVGGLLGERIDATIYRNLLQLDVERDFLALFRTRDNSDCYVGLGKLMDAAVHFAQYARDPEVVAFKERLFASVVATQDPDGYIGIMPPETLPCFCSGTIEHHIARIPGLAPRFVYSNDDCMFYRPLRPDFFFARDGYPFFRFGGTRNPSPEARAANYNYICNLERADALVRAACPASCGELEKAMSRYPHHCIDAYRTDDLLETYARYRDALLPTFAFPFRSPDKVQRVLYAYDAIARGHGHFRLARFRVKEKRAWWKRILRPGYADSLQFFGEGWREGPEMLRRWRPGLFCFNDTESATDDDRAWLRQTMESLFSERSSFEKEGA